LHGELATGHGGWSTRNVRLQGSDSRLATIAAGGSIAIAYDATAGVVCSDGDTCAVQLQIGTNASKLGCLIASEAQGNHEVAAVNVMGQTMTLGTFDTAGMYELVVDPASDENGCGSAWTNGAQSDVNEIIGYVCVTAP